MGSKRDLGEKGEALALSFLKKKKYKILEQNFRTRVGEIDVIARDGKTVCFIEVKARRSHRSGSPLEAVSRAKQFKLIQVALFYIQKHRLQECSLRFDVVAVDLSGPDSSIMLVKNAFETSDTPYR